MQGDAAGFMNPLSLVVVLVGIQQECCPTPLADELFPFLVQPVVRPSVQAARGGLHYFAVSRLHLQFARRQAFGSTITPFEVWYFSVLSCDSPECVHLQNVFVFILRSPLSLPTKYLFSCFQT